MGNDRIDISLPIPKIDCDDISRVTVTSIVTIYQPSRC